MAVKVSRIQSRSSNGWWAAKKKPRQTSSEVYTVYRWSLQIYFRLTLNTGTVLPVRMFLVWPGPPASTPSKSFMCWICKPFHHVSVPGYSSYWLSHQDRQARGVVSKTPTRVSATGRLHVTAWIQTFFFFFSWSGATILGKPDTFEDHPDNFFYASASRFPLLADMNDRESSYSTWLGIAVLSIGSFSFLLWIPLLGPDPRPPDFFYLSSSVSPLRESNSEGW
jgi:hypothetical protein